MKLKVKARKRAARAMKVRKRRKLKVIRTHEPLHEYLTGVLTQPLTGVLTLKRVLTPTLT